MTNTQLRLEKLEEIKNRLLSLNIRFKTLLEKDESLTSDLEELKIKSENLVKSITTQQQAIEVFQILMDKISYQHIERIKSILNYALQSIFKDEDYKISIRVIDKRNLKTSELFLIQTIEGEEREIPLNDSVGGGIISVIGFILQVYFITQFQQSPVIFLDEAFSQVSSKYIPPLIEFIKELAKEKGFIVILISHSDQIISEADRIYKIHKGKVKLLDETTK